MIRSPFIAASFCVALMPHLLAAAPPNILLILTDDQRWDTVRALGNPEIATPNMDKLVAEGFHFNNVYCMGSMVGAVCLPSRTMLITGRSLWRIPEQTMAAKAPAGVATLPQLLNDAGYVTFYCGKATNTCAFANNQCSINIATKPPEQYSAGLHADKTIEFLKAHDPAKPFFAYFAPSVPHDPRVAPAEYHAKYPPEKVTLSKNFMAEHPGDNGDLKVRDEMLASQPRLESEVRQHLADYYATVEHLDFQIGRILATLKERGFAENTFIVFTSDQGLAVGGRHGLMGKQNLYEHVKPPLVLVGPGVKHGSSDALVYLFDLFPTICEAAGVRTPGEVEGRSLWPVVRGEKGKVREYLFGAYKGYQRMVRDERWKLMKYNAGGKRWTQLFDLKDDPDEVRNLAGDVKYAAEEKRMEGLLATARRVYGDPIDFEGTLNATSGETPKERVEKKK